MSGAVKLLIDECIGRPIIQGLAGFVAKFTVQATIKHILDFYPEGIKDELWIPKLAKDNWIVITADRGKRSGGGKLPRLCKEYGVTHVWPAPQNLLQML